MSCPACAANAANPLSGRFHMLCSPCCARLVASTNPDLDQARVMLDAIEMYPGAPAREDTWRAAQELLRMTKKGSAP